MELLKKAATQRVPLDLRAVTGVTFISQPSPYNARCGFGALQGWCTRMCAMTIMQDSMIARCGFGALQGWRTRMYDNHAG